MSEDAAPKMGEVKPPVEEDKPKAKTRKPRGRPLALQRQLEEFFGGIGMVVSTVSNSWDGMLIVSKSEDLAKAWAELANDNASVKRILEQMMQTSQWSQVVLLTAGIAVPIAQNHGAIPPTIPHPFEKPPRVKEELARMEQVAAERRAATQQASPVTPPHVPEQ